MATVAGKSDLVIAADLLEADAPARIIETVVRERGRLDILVNNAGAGLYTPSHIGSVDLARRVFELNLFAPLELVRQAVPVMKRGGKGMIVNVSSIAGAVTLPWFTMYSSSKAAMLAMTNGLRMELRRSGIRCMSVLPGYVRTRFQNNILAGEIPPALAPMRQRWAITPQQCAEAIVKGVERDARTVVTPASGWALIAAARLFPSVVERRLEAVWHAESLQSEAAPR